MSQQFLTYLREERDRLNQWVAGLAAVGDADNAEIVRLRMFNRKVEQQIDSWAYDLASTGTG